MTKKILLFALLLMMAACQSQESKQIEQNAAEQIVEKAIKAKDYTRAMFLADSLEDARQLTKGQSYYWQGLASYRTMQRHLAEFYWRESMHATESSTSPADLADYARSASYLTSTLCRYNDFSGALKVSVPAASRLEQLHCDTTSDYTNLLIFTGCSHLYFGTDSQTVNPIFNRAYTMHINNVSRKQTRDAYHDAVAGIINVAYSYISNKYYAEGQLWTNRLGELLTDYKERFEADSSYLDKQWARFLVYNAMSLEGLGQRKQAATFYNQFNNTNFSQSLEGQFDAGNYLIIAGRWKEAANNYLTLNDHMAKAQVGYSLENIQKYSLRKYEANLMAGLIDSANATANDICQRLDTAIIAAQRFDAEEQETIRQKEEELAQHQEELTRTRQLVLLLTVGFIVVALTIYTLLHRRNERRLSEKNAQLQVANERAEESSRMKSDFIQQISHEIRTPLNILSGYTQIITSPGMELDDDTRNDINRQITDNTNRITGLVNKMLELSDANSQAVIEQNDDVLAIQVAAQAADQSLIAQAAHLNFDLQIQPEAETAMLHTNLDAATRALTLLLDNAMKFTKPAEAYQQTAAGNDEKKLVVVRVLTADGQVQFVVEDNGIGVPPAEAEHIFEEFVQLDEYYDGTGIGLTVARSLARRLGGNVVLDTTYTTGARFVFTLPQLTGV